MSSFIGTLRSTRQSPAPSVHDVAAPIDQELHARKAAGIDISPLQMIFEAPERGSRQSADWGKRGWGRASFFSGWSGRALIAESVPCSNRLALTGSEPLRPAIVRSVGTLNSHRRRHR